ncbi:malto-oligosyltrehalose synthase [Plantibacter sp. YIM 135249]|uniref:malto-oligosyltrehalose synthase n=1 Tax=Plantibacter sp. YIM 135249 TaxID=3423918 RepID=UPI003D33A100
MPTAGPTAARTAVPTSTYRLQLTADFTLQDAAGIVDYLQDLGVGWVYLSPVLPAEPGSTHGYDVVDHRGIDAARGGEAGLEALSAAAHDAGLGVLIDIVPNHMGVATPKENAWWWELLRLGQDSPTAHAFDIDWEAGGGRVRLPVLGDGDGHGAGELDALELVDGALAYYDHRFPIAPGSADDGASAQEVHDRQHYELVNWRRADTELNYRRFFAVNSLAGIRVELPDVFDDSHVEIRRWFEHGLADGLRVDHPDGLQDPAGYLERLAGLTGGAPVWVEKILEGDEALPSDWATAGTTGYDALGDVDRLFVDPSARDALGRLAGIGGAASLVGSSAAASTGQVASTGQTRQVWETLVHGTKRAIADGILGSEVRRLARLARAADPEPAFPDDVVIDALAELLAAFPVYRSYLPEGADRPEEAIRSAVGTRPELSEPINALAVRLRDPEDPIAIRFQQTSGMVMAKGVEDTAFYRFTALTSLTEVGADPAEFAIDQAAFHRRQLVRQESWPASLTTLSTHDTKRSEDVRARISAISEQPERWAETVATLHGAIGFPDRALEQLLWQAVVGAWPISRQRLHAYAEKAAREAGDATSWIDPDTAFEAQLHASVDAVFDRRRAYAAVAAAVGELDAAGRSNALCAKAIQLTMPGVPDVYQGSELWDRSLVDPDNRRPVDFESRRRLLGRLDAGWLPSLEGDLDGAAKLLVTSRVLRLRRDHPERFTGYEPLLSRGPAAEHVVAFSRGGVVTVATRLSHRLTEAGGWRGTTVQVPNGVLVDVITGSTVGTDRGDALEGGGRMISVASLLARYPVAVLTVDDGGAQTAGTGTDIDTGTDIEAEPDTGGRTEHIE